MIRTIPLSKLRPSPRNVRQSIDAQADLQLKADIEARGLLQNLLVVPAKKPRGTFDVEAGGRRLRALKSLVDEGRLPAMHEVNCLVLKGGPAAAREAGLAENFQRLAMNPADECLAFGQLIEQGSDVEGIARRFGLTARFVEGRLRLAALAPVVFEALGGGEISLEVAKAYAATPDLERQAWVFEQVRGSYAADHSDSIRRMMTQATAGASDRRALFVGEQAYLAAGGRIERDLFSEEAGERWLDLPLLERLATEKMEALAAEKAAETGLAWVRPTLDSWIGHPATAGLHRFVPEREPLTEEEANRIETARVEVDELIDIIGGEHSSDEARREAEEKADALDREIAALRDRPAILDEALKPRLGAFLLLDESGVPRLDSAFYAETALEPSGSEAEVSIPGTPNGAAGAGEGAARDGRSPTLSRALVDELAIQRRDILAVHVASDTGLALDLSIFLMVEREVVHTSERNGSSLFARPPSDPIFGFKTPEAAATVARAQAAEALDLSWTTAATRGARFDAFSALPEQARAAWLGHVVARTLEASANAAGERGCAFHDHLGRLLGIDVAKWWRPTGANFFDRVPKAVTLAVLEDVGGSSFAANHAKLKKAELSEAAERIFAGEFLADVEVKERALAWVPEAMRFAPAPAPFTTAADETPPWEDESVDEPLPRGEAERERGGSGRRADGLEPSKSKEQAG